jgi:hypothetical protein
LRADHDPTLLVACSRSLKDGNGCLKPETRWVFAPLGNEHGSIFIIISLLIRKMRPNGFVGMGL